MWLRSTCKVYFFTQKSMPMIRALSSKMEGTILKSKLRWTCWDQEPPSKLAEGRHSSMVNAWLRQARPKDFGTIRVHLANSWNESGAIADLRAWAIPLQRERSGKREGARRREKSVEGEGEVVPRRGRTVKGKSPLVTCWRDNSKKEPQEEGTRENRESVRGVS